MISDETLVRDYQAGDSRAIDSLIQRYQAPLWYYARGVSWYKDKSFIDNIRQRVFVIILKRLKRFTPAGEGSFKRWTYKICKNICLDENQKARRKEIPLSERYFEEFPGYLVKVRPEPTIDPEVFNQRRKQLARALETLKPLDRKLFDLRRDGLSYKQIKETVDFQKFSLGRLRLKYYEIMEKLRTIIEKETQ